MCEHCSLNSPQYCRGKLLFLDILSVLCRKPWLAALSGQVLSCLGCVLQCMQLFSLLAYTCTGITCFKQSSYLSMLKPVSWGRQIIRMSGGSKSRVHSTGIVDNLCTHIFRAVIDMQLCWHVVDMRKSSRCRHKYISRHISTCYSNQICPIVAFCWPSFILWLQCVLYFRVCSISWLFLCAMNINESVISITSSGSRHGKLIVR